MCVCVLYIIIYIVPILVTIIPISPISIHSWVSDLFHCGRISFTHSNLLVLLLARELLSFRSTCVGAGEVARRFGKGQALQVTWTLRPPCFPVKKIVHSLTSLLSNTPFWNGLSRNLCDLHPPRRKLSPNCTTGCTRQRSTRQRILPAQGEAASARHVAIALTGGVDVHSLSDKWWRLLDPAFGTESGPPRACTPV